MALIAFKHPLDLLLSLDLHRSLPLGHRVTYLQHNLFTMLQTRKQTRTLLPRAHMAVNQRHTKTSGVCTLCKDWAPLAGGACVRHWAHLAGGTCPRPHRS